MMEEKATIKFWDLVFVNVTAQYGIRWVAKSTAASFGFGVGAIPMWVLCAVVFFIPESLICAELASTYPTDGGLYAWVREAFGEKMGFLAAWLNWTGKAFWYAGFLTFFVINLTYVFGHKELAENKWLVLGVSVVMFWILSFISTKGLARAKMFTTASAMGSTIPTVVMIVLAVASVLLLKTLPCAADYRTELRPNIDMDAMVAYSTLMFALSGSEVCANFVTSIDRPQKTIPRAIFMAAAIIAGLYIFGSIAITMVMPTEEITGTTGILDAIARAAASLGIGMWFVRLMAVGIALSVAGGVVLYVASPVKMLFGSVSRGVFSDKIMECNAEGMPTRAVYGQAVFVTVILLGTSLLPAVGYIYNILVSITALTGMIPYVLLFSAYIRLRSTRPDEVRPYAMCRNTKSAVVIATIALIACALSVVLSAAPAMKTQEDNLAYEAELIGGGMLVVLLGLFIWRVSQPRRLQARQE